MTDLIPNRVRAYDRLDEFDDVLHYIHEFPETVPASRIRALPGQTAVPYVWEDHMDINPTTGEVSVDRLPNMEPRPSDGFHHFPFKVAATDGLNVTLQDVMFNVEHVVEKPVWGTQVTDFSRVEGTTFSAQFSAFDPEQGVLTYTVSGLNGFTMSATGLLSGTTPENATPNVKDVPFTVTVSSSTSGQQSVLNCVLHITNNNQGPVWNSPSVFNIQPGPWITDLSATDREGDTVTYSIEVGAPAGFVITGSSLSRVFPEQTMSYPVAITATSGKNTPREKKTTLVITVNVTDFPNDPPVWVTPAGSIGGGEGGSAFSYQLQATDTELVTYVLASGTLPPGLSLASNGLISGTMPMVAQGTSAFTFTINATDGENNVPRTFSISSTKTNNPPAWTTASGLILDVWAGQPFDVQLAASDPEGAALSYTISKPAELSWLNMSATGRVTGTVPLTAPATSSNLIFNVSISDGVHVVPREFQVRVKVLAPQTVSFTSSTSWPVPEGCYQIMYTWIVAGGGGGGAGHQYGNGGGGGGGGSGGVRRHVLMSVTPGETIQLNVGDGGAGSIGGAGDRVVGTGGHGGDTVVQNGSRWTITTEGGRGGAISTNWNQGYIVAPGGAGGTPDGQRGTDGPAGFSDRASSPGGAGANGPTIGSFGGAGGIAGADGNTVSGLSTGRPGQGKGSGGGGGGCRDRAANGYWRGGAGANGFIEFTFPSQGVVTDENSPHYGTKPFVAYDPGAGGNDGGFGGNTGGGGSTGGGGGINDGNVDQNQI